MDNINNFILQEVINDLMDVDSSLFVPLMKLYYFGKRINNSDLIDFTNKEINGYDPNDEVPEYRKTSQKLIANVRGYMVDQDIEIPISMLEHPFNISFKYGFIYDGIQIVEKMAKEMMLDDGKNEIYHTMAMEYLSIVQDVAQKVTNMKDSISVQSAKTISNAHIFLEIQSSIRTKLLDFVMELGEKFSYNIEIESFKQNSQINNLIINNIMNTTITSTGDGNVMNTGNGNNISISNSIIKNDLESLKSEMRKHGIDEEDIIELAEIVSEEKLDEKNNIGDNSRNWILKIVDKSMQGIGKISTAVSANLLATLVKTYYGLE